MTAEMTDEMIDATIGTVEVIRMVAEEAVAVGLAMAGARSFGATGATAIRLIETATTPTDRMTATGTRAGEEAGVDRTVEGHVGLPGLAGVDATETIDPVMG